MQQSSPNDIHFREQQAERNALTVIVYANVNDCLEAHGIAPSIIVTNVKGETITIGGGDLFDKKTWKTFLKKTQQTTEIYQLTGNVELLSKQYTEWILTKYTPRYCAISASPDLAWVESVAVLVVKRRILEQKYDAYITRQRATFADPSLIACVAVITAYHHMIKESARIVHHIMKDTAQGRALLQQLSEIYRHLAPEIQMRAGQVLTSNRWKTSKSRPRWMRLEQPGRQNSMLLQKCNLPNDNCSRYVRNQKPGKPRLHS